MVGRVLVAVAWSLFLTLPFGALSGGVAALAHYRLRRSAARARYWLLSAAHVSLPVLFLALCTRFLIGGAVPASSMTTRLLADAPGAVRVPAWVAALAPLMTTAWLLGAGFMLMRMWHAHRNVRRIAARATPVPSGLQSAWQRVQTRLAVGGDIASSHDVDTPAVIGHRNPMILLPPGIDHRLDAEQLDRVLAHEAVHIRRFDYTANLVFTAITAVFWFHPLAHRVARALGEAREFAADHEAVTVLGKPLVLARALERLESARGAARTRLALAADGEPLFRRISALLAPPRRTTRRDRAWVATALLVGACMVGLCFSLLPADLAEFSVLARGPAARAAQLIDAHDDAGPFHLSVRQFRAVHARVEGTAFPVDRIRQRGSDVRFIARDGSTLFTVQLRPEGGMTWESRPRGFTAY